MESMGVASGCSCKEVYRYPHITYSYSSCICSFCSSIPTFCSMLFVCTMGINNNCSLAGYMLEKPSIIIRLSCLLYVFKNTN